LPEAGDVTFLKACCRFSKGFGESELLPRSSFKGEFAEDYREGIGKQHVEGKLLDKH
jgi:hypothetical protein